MLSRLHDERVFTGSHDVVFSEASARDTQQRLLGTAQATTPRGMRKQLTRRQRQQIESGSDAEHKAEDSGESDGDEVSSSGNDGSDDDDKEEELLRNSRHPPSSRYHPQHPYNAQLFTLAKKTQKPVDGNVLARNGKSTAAFVYENHHPMEFVYLPNGEIRPRDECPPGLVLPPPVTQASIGAAEIEQHFLAEDAFADRGDMQRQQQQQLGSAPTAVRASTNPETSHRTLPTTKTTGSTTAVTASQRPGANISIVGYTKKERTSRRSRSSSESSEEDSDSSSARYQSSAAKRTNATTNDTEVSPQDESSDSEASDAFASPSESEVEEKENVRRQGTARGTTQKQQVMEKSSAKRADVTTKSRPVAPPTTRGSSTSRNKSARPAVRKHKTQSQQQRAQPQFEVDVSEEQQQPVRRGKMQTEYSQPGTHEKHRKPPLPSPSSASDASQTAWVRRPKAVKYDDLQSKLTTHAVDGKQQQKKSTKMDVRDLLSENSRVKIVKTKPSREQNEKIEFLEKELQKEKKRVLEKMTQLLEEQGKNQQLQHQVDVFQSQLASKQRDAEVKVKEVLKSKDESLGQVDAQWKARVQALDDQLHVKDAAVVRLQNETEQLKNTVNKLKDRERQSSSLSKEKEALANHQFEKILAKLKKFRVRVESWKASSKEAMDVCDRNSDLLGLMDTLWLDFPAFPSFLDANGENQMSNGEKRSDTSDNANMILFLKKRLRLREDELHQTHVKYVELKELCARQCVREADLQNFINDHRLRGNLIIRKDGTTPIENNANDGRRNVQFQEQQQRSESKKKVIVNRGTNTSPTYYEEDESDEGGREEYEEYEEDDGDQEEEDEQQQEYYVREPKVFVQVGRDGVYEHAPSRSSAVVRKLEEDQVRHARKKKEPREVERIRLVPSPTLARRYERVPAPSEEYVVATARRKAPSVSTPPRSTTNSNRLTHPPSISATRTAGVVRRKQAAQIPSSIGRSNGTRTMSVSSRVSRSASVPWV